MQKIIGILLLLGAVLFTSCGASLYTVRVQVLAPARSSVHLGHEQELCIAMPYSKYENSDSLQSVYLLRSLQRVLSEVPTLKNTDISLRMVSLHNDTSLNQVVQQLQQDSLGTLLVVSRLKGNVFRYPYYGTYVSSNFCYQIAKDDHIQQVCDSVVTPIYQFNHYPDILTAQLAQYLAPYWENTTRDIYVDNSRAMQQARNLVAGFRWSEAMQLWANEVNAKNAKRSAQAAFNMAVACEMLDKYELAQEWIAYSISLVNDSVSANYAKQLQQRMEQNRQIAGGK
jgi:hypothetical protein